MCVRLLHDQRPDQVELAVWRPPSDVIAALWAAETRPGSSSSSATASDSDAAGRGRDGVFVLLVMHLGYSNMSQHMFNAYSDP